MMVSSRTSVRIAAAAAEAKDLTGMAGTVVFAGLALFSGQLVV